MLKRAPEPDLLRLGTAIRWAALLPDGYRVNTRTDIAKWLGFSPKDVLYRTSLRGVGAHFVDRARAQLCHDGIVPRAVWSRFSGTYNPVGIVVLCPQSSVCVKDWPFTRFNQLAQQLQDRGYTVEWQTAGDLYALEAQLRRARLVVGVDTGPLHLADYMGIPVVGLYGTTDPVFHGPRGPYAITQRHVSRNIACLDADTVAACVLAHLHYLQEIHDHGR